MKLFFTTEAQRAQSLIFSKNREIPIFENLSACGTYEPYIREATGWFLFGGISRQIKN
jgi:hypothetical protein